MTTDHFITHWPLNMAIADYDIRPGERALVESDLFRAHKLCLLCGANLCDMSRRYGSRGHHGPLPRSLYDYLVCKGPCVLLAIHLTDRKEWYGRCLDMPGLPMVKSTCQQFSQGDISDVLEALDTVIREAKPSVWSCRLQPCSPELTEAMLYDVLLEAHSNGSLMPTEYGTCSGLARMVMPSGRCFTLCSAETASHLTRLLAAKQLHEANVIPPKDHFSFDIILKTYRNGIAYNVQSSANLVQAVMDMPLAQYMDGFPEELNRLKEALPESCVTYGDAACGIYEMLHAPNDPDDSQYLLGINLMQDLAAPPVEDQRVTAAIQLGRNAFARMPDALLGRYLKPPKSQPIHSFRDCVSSVSGTRSAGMKLASSPMATFFQGVSILARSGYPHWLSRTLQSYLNISGRQPYASLLLQADEYYQQEDSPQAMSLGIRMFYLLLIEPFRLICENRTYNQYNFKEVKTNEL